MIDYIPIHGVRHEPGDQEFVPNLLSVPLFPAAKKIRIIEGIIMNKTTVFLLVVFAIVNGLFAVASDDIRINQLGYYPKSVKTVVVVNSTSPDFTVQSIDGNILFTGKLTDQGTWKLSGEKIKTGNFSGFQTSGSYRIHVADKGGSHEFTITPHLYRGALKGAVKKFYFQRASMKLEEKYAGKWHRPMGQPDTTCYFHPSSGRSKGTMASPGGWYDAGDYNKYIVNAGITVSMMLGFYELYPASIPDNSMNIPESGNGISDLLDELKYELDWVLTMQDTDGGVFFKLTSKQFSGFIMPHQDTSQRFVVGKGTAPALNFAAMTSQAARIFQPIDKAYANKLLKAAQRAWQWALKNKTVYFKNPPDIKTGEYGDEELEDEFYWAAVQLLLTTNDRQYLPYAGSYLDNVNNKKKASWRYFLDELGTLSLSVSKNTVAKKLKTKAKEVVIRLADDIRKEIQSIPYRIPKSHYVWGSNSDLANDAVILAHAYILTGESRYLVGVCETVDYLFGKNATGYSFVTGFGNKTPMNLHHRPSGADGIADPIPGFLVGGPNQERQDALAKNKTYGVKYPHKEPARSYLDQTGSFASNEVCINWNAPLVFILGFLEANSDTLQ